MLDTEYLNRYRYFYSKNKILLNRINHWVFIWYYRGSAQRTLIIKGNNLHAVIMHFIIFQRKSQKITQ